jgi:glycosyltransferase involved in cell wall biosynthesis
MNIGFDSQIFLLQKEGGISRYFTNIIKELLRRDDINVFNYKFQYHFNNHLQELATPKRKNSKSKLLESLKLDLINRLKYSKVNNNVSILHHTYYSRFGFDLDQKKSLHVSTIHDMYDEKFRQSQLSRVIFNKKKYIKKSNLLLCVSQATKNEMLNYYDIDNDKIVVNPLSVDQRTFRILEPEDAKTKDKLFLLHVGKRGEYKNFKIILHALVNRNLEEIQLVNFSGVVPSIEEMRLIEKLGLTKRVKFVSGNDKELNILYNSCLALVVPSLYEGFSLPIVEAYSSGARIIASRIPAHLEFANLNLSFFDPEDKNDLIRNIEKIRNLHIVNKLNMRGAQDVLSYYSWERHVDKLIESYEKII